jgi:hypothetical protein
LSDEVLDLSQRMGQRAVLCHQSFTTDLGELLAQSRNDDEVDGVSIADEPLSQ